jgi:hypothetical protein
MNWIIKPGFFMKAVKGMKQAGLDLGRVIGDWMVSKGLLVSGDCCLYYPTVPVIAAEDITSPSEEEMEDVPLFGIFRTYDSETGDLYIYMKLTASTVVDIATSV